MSVFCSWRALHTCLWWGLWLTWMVRFLTHFDFGEVSMPAILPPSSSNSPSNHWAGGYPDHASTEGVPPATTFTNSSRWRVVQHSNAVVQWGSYAAITESP